MKIIDLFPILGKMFEKVIFDSLYDYFVYNKLLTPRQFDFINGDSCGNQRLAITHEIYKKLKANRSIGTICVFPDLSKAFDKVWHTGLICNLKSNGIQPRLLTHMNNYLSNRWKSVLLNGITSSWKSIRS